MKNIRIGITGYGNIGRGVETAIRQNDDMELVGVFTRRNPESITLQTENVKVYSVEDALFMVDKIDVMILCGGSATDLPVQSPQFALMFNIVDSYDNHSKIPEHFAAVDNAAKVGGNLAIISTGWDPGLFSLNRLFGNAFLPKGNDYTFWGKGVSQGHSDAIRRVEGVLDAKQYTIPCEDAIEAACCGKNPTLTTHEKHTRECFVVASPTADKKRIESDIKNMPSYFADYDTTVHFISQEELEKNHSRLPHGGFVIRSGHTGDGENKHLIKYSLNLDSNPEFTGNVLVAFARAAYRLSNRGEIGAKTVFDIAPIDLSPESREDLIKRLL
ncbi:MAG: diaminopimelate dehydrogenase [Clostridiales bacterium]|jgi:diaminopimelate dehydrogenase|nr:diaminopimelate dehydrogenase [Clostridiales bacterium]